MTTSRQLYEALLIELNKENAPNLLLEDFNYYANKTINQYINKRYNIYDINQQTTDDLRVLKADATLNVKKISRQGLSLANDATYEVILPLDYLHILNCICVYKVNKTYKCYNKDETWRAAAKRLTADSYSQIIDNFWNKPTYKKPYYYIHNTNTLVSVPTNPYTSNLNGTDVDPYAVINKSVTSFVGSKYNGIPLTNIKEGYNATVANFQEQENGVYSWNTDDQHYNVYSASSNAGALLFTDPLSIYLDSSHENYFGTLQESLQLIPGDTFNFYGEENDRFLWKKGSTIVTTDSRNPQVNDNYLDSYNKLWRITSINVENDIETDCYGNPIIDTSGVNIFTSASGTSNIERSAGVRYGNASLVRMEIRYGTDDSVFQLLKVYIDYIKAPLNIRLTQKQLDLTEDTSQVLEWPDYVCQEIVNELVHAVMERDGDLRIQTHPIVTLSIATQQLTAE